MVKGHTVADGLSSCGFFSLSRVDCSAPTRQLYQSLSSACLIPLIPSSVLFVLDLVVFVSRSAVWVFLSLLGLLCFESESTVTVAAWFHPLLVLGLAFGIGSYSQQCSAPGWSPATIMQDLGVLHPVSRASGVSTLARECWTPLCNLRWSFPHAHMLVRPLPRAQGIPSQPCWPRLGWPSQWAVSQAYLVSTGLLLSCSVCS